ncbi:MAG: hypothetical protein IKA65_07445 [Lentisphaeria bacterium]|nr:hypothetical protein [Lentisphaeria bacterium]
MSSANNNFFSKEFWRSRRGQRIFCIAGLAASALFLLVQFGGSLGSVFPGSGGKAALARELKKLEQDQEKLKLQLAELDVVKNIAESKFNGAWKQSRNGVPEVELRSLIENAAKTLELRLNNISTVRKTNFNKDLSLLEVDVSVMTDIDTLMKFLLAVDKLEPKLYWRRFECRTSNMFGMMGVNFNGTLRCANDERVDVPVTAPAAKQQKGAAK